MGEEKPLAVTLLLCNLSLKCQQLSFHKEEQQILKEECEGHYERRKQERGICSDMFLGEGDVICTAENTRS